MKRVMDIMGVNGKIKLNFFGTGHDVKMFLTKE